MTANRDYDMLRAAMASVADAINWLSVDGEPRHMGVRGFKEQLQMLKKSGDALCAAMAPSKDVTRT